jgi:hypothetical protein
MPPLPDGGGLIKVRVARDRQLESIVRVDDIHAVWHRRHWPPGGRFAAMPATFSSRVGYSTHPDRHSGSWASASSRARSLRRSRTWMASRTNRDARNGDLVIDEAHRNPAPSETARDTQALAAAADHYRAHFPVSEV